MSDPRADDVLYHYKAEIAFVEETFGAIKSMERIPEASLSLDPRGTTTISRALVVCNVNILLKNEPVLMVDSQRDDVVWLKKEATYTYIDPGTNTKTKRTLPAGLSIKIASQWPLSRDVRPEIWYLSICQELISDMF